MSSGLFKPIHGQDLPKNALIARANLGWYDQVLHGKCDFFEKLGAAAQSRGIATFLIHSDSLDAPDLAAEGHTLINIGPRRLQGPNIFHAFPAYIKGFWYLDTQGYFWNSSMMTAVFDPDRVDLHAATIFFNRASAWRIDRNISQRWQPPSLQLPPADVAVFTQDLERYSDVVHYLSTREIVRAAASAVAGLCYVKAHPLMTKAQTDKLAKLCARFPNARLVDASVHDIIAASGVIVSQNSAAGFEAMMHKKPVITCARTDYATASLVSKTTAQLRDNIRRAPNHFANFPFEKYFYWFLGLNMLQPQNETFTARAMTILYGE